MNDAAGLPAAAATTGLYAGLLALLYAGLALRVVRLRVVLKQPLGDGGHAELQRAVRVHGHFAEYVPLALLLLLLLELAGMPAALLHGYGLLLLVSRAAHAIGVGRSPEHLGWRLAAMVVTCHLLAGAALLLITMWLRA
ncbi:MAPEG family protein [Pseudaquabacterium pictum]|uniref:Glutathione S-transferase n=1 Tax=Pseudaquabacterium pictum TaxID=2315236 RepID=A0A480AWY0_9BURK|nr:MAPEG family protein [Rubrivivax pictus]GCL66229.1 hypothetical protein AQPW35_53100 [Rubrivivax pictus]